MFGFGKISRDPLGDVKSAQRWLDSLPSQDALVSHSHILTELGRIAQTPALRTPSCLAAVFHADTFAIALRKTLTDQYIEHASRSSKLENQLWLALFDLTQGFLVCYGSFAREVSEHAQSNKWQALLPELVARQITHLGLDAKIRLYRFEQWIPAKWADLHGLFTLACSRQFERLPIMFASGGGSTTIEHEYLIALVLQLMNTGNMTPRHVDWVSSNLDAWCAPLRLTLEASSSTSFYVDLSARTGLKRRIPAPLEGRVLFLDTRPLHSLLVQNIVMLEQKIRSQPLSDKTSRRNDQLNLLTKLASQVDPEFRPFARRGERTTAVGQVDAIVGFAKISTYLREEDQAPLPEVAPSATDRSYGATLDIALFGHTRNESERRHELARARLIQYTTPGGPWEVKDVSQTGFRLVAPMSAANIVTLGTLAAIRPIGHTVWVLGVVRRVKRLTTDRAEVGLQVIANALAGVDLIEQRKTTEGTYATDASATTFSGRIFHALFLSLKKREGESVVQSLIVPAFEYQPTKRFRLQTVNSTRLIRFGHLLEQQPEWVWATIEPLEVVPGADPEAVPGPGT